MKKLFIAGLSVVFICLASCGNIERKPLKNGDKTEVIYTSVTSDTVTTAYNIVHGDTIFCYVCQD